MVLDGVSAFPRVLSPLGSPCTCSCFPLLDGVSAFPRVLSPLVSLLVSRCWMVCPPFRGSCLPCLFPFVGSRVCLPEGLVSPCLPLYPLLFPFVAWCVRLSDGPVSLCLTLYPLPVSLCWMVCPPSRASCLPFSTHYLPSCSPIQCAALGVLNAFLRCPPWSCLLSPLISRCLPTCVPG